MSAATKRVFEVKGRIAKIASAPGIKVSRIAVNRHDWAILLKDTDAAASAPHPIMLLEDKGYMGDIEVYPV